MSMYRMPKIDLETLRKSLSASDYALVAGIVNTRTGDLRASKPQLPKKAKIRNPNEPLDSYYAYRYDYATEADADKGKTAYIWRMVAFAVSPHPEHHCMPVCADFDLPDCASHDARRELAKELDAIADVVVNSIPKSQWAGVIRWDQAFGMVGSPQYAPDGSIIYR